MHLGFGMPCGAFVLQHPKAKTIRGHQAVAGCALRRAHERASDGALCGRVAGPARPVRAARLSPHRRSRLSLRGKGKLAEDGRLGHGYASRLLQSVF